MSKNKPSKQTVTPPGEFSSETLRTALWQTITGVQTGTISPQQANAVARASKEVLATIKTEIQAANTWGGEKPKGATKFMGSTETTKKFLGLNPKAKQTTTIS